MNFESLGLQHWLERAQGIVDSFFSHGLELLSAMMLVTLPQPQSCQIIACHDGDTCSMVCAGEKIKVRLHCIDAPEMSQADWGVQSRDVLRNRLPAGSTVEFQWRDDDQYGRQVGVLVQDQVNINLQMVYSGWAATYRAYCQERDFYEAEQDAKIHQRGIWRVTGLHQRPWEWRKRQHK